jgi:hypothetical protein
MHLYLLIPLHLATSSSINEWAHGASTSGNSREATQDLELVKAGAILHGVAGRFTQNSIPRKSLTRHLETSEGAQPDSLKRPIANEGDVEAMIESNPEMAAMLATPHEAATGVIEAVLAGEA